MAQQARLIQLILGSVVLAMGNICTPLAHAEPIVSGAQNDLTIEVHDASIGEVLKALDAKFGVRFRGSSSLDRRVDGRYEGTLWSVVMRLLNGYNYVMKADGGRIEVIVLGAAKQNETQSEHGQAVQIPTRRRSD